MVKKTLCSLIFIGALTLNINVNANSYNIYQKLFNKMKKSNSYIRNEGESRVYYKFCKNKLIGYIRFYDNFPYEKANNKDMFVVKIFDDSSGKYLSEIDNKLENKNLADFVLAQCGF